jgi:PAS domain-containing protein
MSSGLFEPPQFPTRQVLCGVAALLAVAVGPFLIWPTLADRILAANFLPHLYCYLGKPGLVWTHVVADSLIGLSYVMISGTLVYLVHKGRRDIPFHWMFLAFGSFIVACGGTHFMEVVTVWVPVYVLSAGVKIFTALVSVTTAVLLPFTVPQILSLIQTAKASEAAEGRFRALLEAAPDAMVVADKAGRMCSSIPKLKGYLGIGGMNCWDERLRRWSPSACAVSTRATSPRLGYRRWKPTWKRTDCTRKGASSR